MKKVLRMCLTLLLLSPIQSLLPIPRHEVGRGSSNYASVGGSGEEGDNFSPPSLSTGEFPTGREELLVRSYIALASSALLGEEAESATPTQPPFHLCLILLSSADAIAETILEQGNRATFGQDAAIPLAPLEFQSEELRVRGNAIFIHRWNPPAFFLSNITVSVRDDEILSDAKILIPATSENPLTGIVLSLVEGKRKIAAALLLLITLISGNSSRDGVIRLDFYPQRRRD